MKITFLKVRDPISFVSDTILSRDELQDVTTMVLCLAGILLTENKDQLVLGEITYAADNPKMKDLLNLPFPHFRHVICINKSNIIARQDFEVKNT